MMQPKEYMSADGLSPLPDSISGAIHRIAPTALEYLNRYDWSGWRGPIAEARPKSISLGLRLSSTRILDLNSD